MTAGRGPACWYWIRRFSFSLAVRTNTLILVPLQSKPVSKGRAWSRRRRRAKNNNFSISRAEINFIIIHQCFIQLVSAEKNTEPVSAIFFINMGRYRRWPARSIIGKLIAWSGADQMTIGRFLQSILICPCSCGIRDRKWNALGWCRILTISPWNIEQILCCWAKQRIQSTRFFCWWRSLVLIISEFPRADCIDFPSTDGKLAMPVIKKVATRAANSTSRLLRKISE